MSWSTPQNSNEPKRYFTSELFVSSMHAVSVKFLALWLVSIILFVKRTIIFIISEKSSENAFNCVFGPLVQPTGPDIYAIIFTDVQRCIMLISGFSVSQIVLHIVLPHGGTLSLFRSLSFSVSWWFSILSCKKSKKFCLNIYHKSLEMHQDLHLLADNIKKCDRLLDTPF